MKILLEYLIVFIILYIVNYIMMIKGHTKYNKKNMPTLIIYLNKIYNIKINKDNYKKMIYICSLTNTFIMTTIYIILLYLVHGWILRIVLGAILLILLTIICYGLLGRYLKKKEGK